MIIIGSLTGRTEGRFLAYDKDKAGEAGREADVSLGGEVGWNLGVASGDSGIPSSKGRVLDEVH